MWSRATRVRGRLATVLVCGGLLVGSAAAQSRDEEKGPFREPGITYMEHSKPYVQWLAGALIIGACLMIAFKNPHRSHLD